MRKATLIRRIYTGSIWLTILLLGYCLFLLNHIFFVLSGPAMLFALKIAKTIVHELYHRYIIERYDGVDGKGPVSYYTSGKVTGPYFWHTRTNRVALYKTPGAAINQKKKLQTFYKNDYLRIKRVM